MAKKSIEDLTNEELITAIKSSSQSEGFFLEEKVAETLKQSFKEIQNIGINVVFDEDGHGDIPRRGLDVFVIGKTSSETSSLKLVACEVKAGGRDSKLILIRKKLLDNDSSPFKIGAIKIGDRNSEGLNLSTPVIPLFENIEPIYCHTGDFYKWNENDERFRKSNTSLYKATEQLFNGIEGFITSQGMETWEDELAIATIIPLIVTNVDIYVAKQDSGVTQTSKIKYAVLENSVRFSHLKINYDPRNPFVDKVFPYCWIVNIDFLEEFMKNPFIRGNVEIVWD